MASEKTVLVTGAGGFVASHVILELLQNNYDVVAMDNFVNCAKDESGLPVSLVRIQQYTGKRLIFNECNLLDMKQLSSLIEKHPVSWCLHFAGLKAVAESIEQPLNYYNNNIIGTLNLLKVLKAAKIKNIIFSSSATVYGTPSTLPLTEYSPTGRELTNPYGKTKYFIEEILRDLYTSDRKWNITILRYFNPVGAHPSSIIGENPSGIPNNLMPNILRAATGQIPCLKIYGNDYETPDGSGVRDYVHVVDLAQGHIAALQYSVVHKGFEVFNLGTGKGISVLEMVKQMEKVSGRKIPYTFESRRAGDLETVYCDTRRAKRRLKWTAKFDLKDMCVDAWNYWIRATESERPPGCSTVTDNATTMVASTSTAA